jgi:hypothetical protein
MRDFLDIFAMVAAIALVLGLFVGLFIAVDYAKTSAAWSCRDILPEQGSCTHLLHTFRDGRCVCEVKR